MRPVADGRRRRGDGAEPRDNPRVHRLRQHDKAVTSFGEAALDPVEITGHGERPALRILQPRGKSAVEAIEVEAVVAVRGDVEGE